MIECIANKNLEVGTKISFFIGGGKLVDGTIREKVPIKGGDIGFLIESENGGLCRMKHRNLDIYTNN